MNTIIALLVISGGYQSVYNYEASGIQSHKICESVDAESWSHNDRSHILLFTREKITQESEWGKCFQAALHRIGLGELVSFEHYTPGDARYDAYRKHHGDVPTIVSLSSDQKRILSVVRADQLPKDQQFNEIASIIAANLKIEGPDGIVGPVLAQSGDWVTTEWLRRGCILGRCDPPRPALPFRQNVLEKIDQSRPQLNPPPRVPAPQYEPPQQLTDPRSNKELEDLKAQAKQIQDEIAEKLKASQQASPIAPWVPLLGLVLAMLVSPFIAFPLALRSTE